VVEVDVTVTDFSGRPLRGLKRGDFSIPGQEIVAFQEVSRDMADNPQGAAMLRVPRDVADNQSARSATLVLLVLDDRVPALERTRMRDTARDVVDRLGEGVHIGLLSTSGRLAFELTDDRARLLAALDRLVWTTLEARTSRVVTGSCDFALLEQAARMLAPMPAQRKAIVAITPGCGIDIKGSVESMAALDAWPIEPPPHVAVRMVDVMRRANVAYYAIDPRGKVGFSLGHFGSSNFMGGIGPSAGGASDGGEGRNSFDGDNVFASLRAGPPGSPMTGDRQNPTWYTTHGDPVILSQEGLTALGDATGGFAVTNTDDLAGGINRLVTDLDHYYVLGFTPSTTKGGFHKLEVHVNNPDALLRYRRGYQMDGVKARSKGDHALPSISGVLAVPDVPLRLMAMPFATATGAPRELFAIEVRAPKDQMAGAGGALSDDVSVTVVAVRSDQARVEQAFAFKRHVTIAPRFAAAAGSTVAYQIVRAIELPSGHYQFRVSVTSARMNSTGSVYLSTDVPDFSELAFQLSGPMVVYADNSRHPASATLIDSGLPAVAPVFDRVFAPSDTVRILCPIWRSGPLTPTSAEIELLDRDNNVALTSKAPIAGDGIMALDATLKLQGVAPGAYRLRISAAQGETIASREIGIAIR
jgi:VWFA-related protein